MQLACSGFASIHASLPSGEAAAQRFQCYKQLPAGNCFPAHEGLYCVAGNGSSSHRQRIILLRKSNNCSCSVLAYFVHRQLPCQFAPECLTMEIYDCRPERSMAWQSIAIQGKPLESHRLEPSASLGLDCTDRIPTGYRIALSWLKARLCLVNHSYLTMQSRLANDRTSTKEPNLCQCLGKQEPAFKRDFL